MKTQAQRDKRGGFLRPQEELLRALFSAHLAAWSQGDYHLAYIEVGGACGWDSRVARSLIAKGLAIDGTGDLPAYAQGRMRIRLPLPLHGEDSRVEHFWGLVAAAKS